MWTSQTKYTALLILDKEHISVCERDWKEIAQCGINFTIVTANVLQEALNLIHASFRVNKEQ